MAKNFKISPYTNGGTLYLKLGEPDVFRTYSVAELVEAAEKIDPGFSTVKR